MAITNEDSIIEALIVGLLTVIVGIVVSSLVKHINNSTCDPVKHDCNGKNVYYFVFFLTGVVIYYFCELAGINDTYCRKKIGSACGKNVSPGGVRFTTMKNPLLGTVPSSVLFVRGTAQEPATDMEMTSPIMSLKDDRSPVNLLDVLFDHSEQSSSWDDYAPQLVSLQPPKKKSFFKMSL